MQGMTKGSPQSSRLKELNADAIKGIIQNLNKEDQEDVDFSDKSNRLEEAGSNIMTAPMMTRHANRSHAK